MLNRLTEAKLEIPHKKKMLRKNGGEGNHSLVVGGLNSYRLFDVRVFHRS
jgi:hypothetical protein